MFYRRLFANARHITTFHGPRHRNLSSGIQERKTAQHEQKADQMFNAQPESGYPPPAAEIGPHRQGHLAEKKKGKEEPHPQQGDCPGLDQNQAHVKETYQIEVFGLSG